MIPAGITVEALPAGYGDNVLVTCALATGVWRLLVDTGPDECWPSLQQRLEQIPADLNGKRHIDLAVISHIDHDHIGAARALFDDRSLDLTFGDIWFNAPPQPTSRGVAEGQSLAPLPWSLPAVLPRPCSKVGRCAQRPAATPATALRPRRARWAGVVH